MSSRFWTLIWSDGDGHGGEQEFANETLARAAADQALTAGKQDIQVVPPDPNAPDTTRKSSRKR